jgi:hypothetical protein
MHMGGGVLEHLGHIEFKNSEREQLNYENYALLIMDKQA